MSSEVKLYVIVYETIDGEPDWFFTTETALVQSEAERLALENYLDFHDYSEEDKAEAKIDDHLGSVWYEQVYAPDGYTIKLVKETANAKA